MLLFIYHVLTTTKWKVTVMFFFCLGLATHDQNNYESDILLGYNYFEHTKLLICHHHVLFQTCVYTFSRYRPHTFSIIAFSHFIKSVNMKIRLILRKVEP